MLVFNGYEHANCILASAAARAGIHWAKKKPPEKIMLKELLNSLQ
jgi:hypothetical protein